MVLPLNLLKSILIATILTLTVIPMFLLIASNDTKWIVTAIIIWNIGTLLVFYPSIYYIYPHLISKIGVYLLNTILIIISAWFNIMIIKLILPYDYIYYALFNATFSYITLMGTIYIIVINAIISNLLLFSNIEFYKEERLF